jgi:hypothetical protein
MCLDIYIRFFQVLYFGDSLCSDSFPANNYAGWDVVLVLEEMEAEGYHLTPKDLECDDTPTTKKLKRPVGLESMFIIINKSSVHLAKYDMSNQQHITGSFFNLFLLK